MKRFLVLIVCAVTAACGSDGGPTGPTPPAHTVTAISPASGPVQGGTSVTITGTNFSSPAVVTLGGAFATNVTVVSPTSITAITPQRAVGTVDVAVRIGERTATLSNGFTYASGQAPVIQSLVARGTRSSQPERLADLGEEITVTATVQDPDTPAGSLTYEWTAPAGAFVGTGASVRWRAPEPPFATPGTVVLSLRVSDGANQATQTVTVRVHDSAREIGDMARLFLEDFSRQQLTPEQVVRNFWDGCGGKASELEDVRKNQRQYRIVQPPDPNGWTVGQPLVTISFGGICSFRARPGDGCASVAVRWYSECINPTLPNGDPECTLGQFSVAQGTDQVAARYAEDRWWLCESDFQGQSINLSTGIVSPGYLFKR